MTKHGEYRNGKASVEATAYHLMMSRCYNPNNQDFHNYGGRGIVVCHEWRLTIENFIRDMGRRPSQLHSLDRINSDGNYERQNCRWATRTEQSRNRRVVKLIAFNGEVKTIRELSEMFGIKYGTLYKRICIEKDGMDRAFRVASIGSNQYS